MTYIIEILRQEHRNIEKVLRVLERELSVFGYAINRIMRLSSRLSNTSWSIRIRVITLRRM